MRNNDRNYRPETIHDFLIEIKVHEKYFNQYEKQINILKLNKAYHSDQKRTLQRMNNSRYALSNLYVLYLNILNKSNKPKLTLVYQSKMNL